MREATVGARHASPYLIPKIVKKQKYAVEITNTRGLFGLNLQA